LRPADSATTYLRPRLATLRGRALLRVFAAVAVGLAVLTITALNEHAPYDIEAGLPARVVAGLAPLLAGGVAALAVLRPWRGFLAVMLLVPVFDVPQVSWTVGSVQIIAHTLFVVALGVGVILRPASEQPHFRWRPRRAPDHVAAVAVAGLLALAVASTALSPDIAASAAILLHGILEPAATAFILLALRPSKRDLTVLLIVMGVSVAIGGVLNLVQSVPAMKTLSVMQAKRLFFSRITYFNVGLFGEMLAMALPLLLAALVGRRRFGLSRAVVALLIASVAVCVVALLLTFSKSGYVAALGAVLVLFLLLMHSNRRRIPVVAATVLVSAALIPWPAFFLQVAPPLEQAYRNAVVTLIGESRYDSWDPSTVSGTGSLVERFYATRAAVEMAVDHPLLGIGLNQFKGQYLDHYRPAEAKLSVDWAHSMFAEVAAELGFPALFLDILIYAAALFALWRVYRAPPDPATRLLACALLAAVVAWLLVGTAFAGDMYRDWRNMASDYVMMMVVMAASFALYRMSRTAEDGATADATASAG
jgi:O-antigen ligase